MARLVFGAEAVSESAHVVCAVMGHQHSQPEQTALPKALFVTLLPVVRLASDSSFDWGRSLDQMTAPIPRR